MHAKAKLPEWAGFHLRLGTEGSKGRDVASDGLVTVIFKRRGRDIAPLTEEDQRLVRWFEDHHAEQSEPILTSVFAAYPAFKQAYREDYGLDDVEDILPEISGPRDLRGLIKLNEVVIHRLEASGMPYIGYEFECAWDGEHALGVLLHGTRVAVVGDANVAFTRWIAERDAAGRQ